MNKKGLSIAIILVVIAFLGSIALFVGYKIHANKKFTQSIQELAQTTVNDLKEKHPNGEFPEEMKDFLSNSTENLIDYCFSHPDDLRDKKKMYRHYEGVLLYKKTALSRYKKDLLPKIKKLVGKFSKPDCFENSSKTAQKSSLPYSPDLKKYQNTLIEWCLIANCFEEKDDGNSAFLLSYAAARLSIKLLTDYADSASEENLRTANNILRCACCQLIYIANSGLKHNSKMVRAMAKDLYAISENYSPLSRTVNYELDEYENMIKKLSEQGNYAITSLSNPNTAVKDISNELRKLFDSLYNYCDLPYHESNKDISTWDNKLRTEVSESVNKLESKKPSKLIAYAFISNKIPDYLNLRLITDETRVIIDGTATVLATYEYIDNHTGSFKYSPSLIAQFVGSTSPDSKLSGVSMDIYLPGSNIISSKEHDVISYKNFETVIKTNKYNNMKYETINNDFGIKFLTKDEYILKNLRQESKSNYFDLDEALSKMTPEQRANIEKMEIEKEKKELEKKENELENEEYEDELTKEYTEKYIKVDSIDDILCGYKFGTVAKNVKESSYLKSGSNGFIFTVKSKKPFLGEFKLATIHVGNNKKIYMIIYQKGYDTTSERETTYKRIKTAIESMEGIKLVKHSEDYEKEQDEYSKEKEDYEIKLSLLKGLDGGGTISLGASSVTALLDSMKEE